MAGVQGKRMIEDVYGDTQSESEGPGRSDVQSLKFAVEDLTEATYEGIKNDCKKVEEFIRAAQDYMKDLDLRATEGRIGIMEYGREKGIRSELIGRAARDLEVLKADADKVRRDARSPPRLVGIEFGIEDSKMNFRHDYDNFVKRIDDLSKWHGKEQTDYLAPYFPIIQSSGMGKTKLMHEYRNNHKRNTRLILCLPAGRDAQLGFYDSILKIPDVSMGLETVRDNIRTQLDFIVKNMGNVPKVILLFDEAQFLLESKNEFAFRVIRWWLRRNKFMSQQIQICASFAGTTSHLSSYIVEDSSPSNFSRIDSDVYNDGAKLYEPFCQLHTIGVLKKNVPNYSDIEGYATTDLDNAVRFGRPLFALMSRKAPSDDDKLMAIGNRIRLGEKLHQDISLKCRLSVLGTRVQMGHTSFQISSEIVARGYACLTTTYSTNYNHLAYIWFFPDPVCAFVAMKMMVAAPQDDLIVGFAPNFWTSKAISIFTTGLCCPTKGEIGEVSSALYLLFCGDVLRGATPLPRTFAVPLCALLQLAAEPKNFDASTTQVPTDTPHEPCVSFIQVCRNFLRHTLKELSKKCYLEEWFKAGYAIYTYPNCEIFDIIIPVRIRKEKNYDYFPMLVSVKNRVAYPPCMRGPALEAMANCFKTLDKQVGICVLLLIGLSSNVSGDTPEFIRMQFENWTGDTVLTFTIAVPENDPFGCWDLATQPSTDGGVEAEIYASHVFAHQTAAAASSEPVSRLLRSKASTAAIKGLTALIRAFLKF